MGKFILSSILIWWAVVPPIWGQLRVVTSYPYIADLTQQMGKGHVTVTALGSGSWDPHFVPPKPSFIAKVRRADLLIINGAENEIGWMPPIIKRSNNPKVQPGNPGFLDLSTVVELIDVPENLSRAEGDVHAAGNPHFYLDPHNIPPLVQAISERLCQLSRSQCSEFQSNQQMFQKEWEQRVRVWDEKMKPLQGQKVIQFHKNFDYFLKRYGIETIATLEPLPGIPPTTKHLVSLMERAQQETVHSILLSVYQSQKPAQFVAKKLNIPVIVLPHDVKAMKDVTNIESLFETLVHRFNP